MKKNVFLMVLFCFKNIFCSIGIEHDLYKSFLKTKIYMTLYADLCQKASCSSETREIEDYLNSSLKSFLSKSLPDIKNQLVVDHVNSSFDQNGWQSIKQCSHRIEKTEKSMLFIIAYDQQIIKSLLLKITQDFKSNIAVRAKSDKREDVVQFIQINMS